MEDKKSLSSIHHSSFIIHRFFSVEVFFAQAEQALEGEARLVAGVEQSSVRELVGLGVGEVTPLDRLNKRLAQGQRPEGGGPVGLGLHREAVAPAARIDAQLRV